MKKILLFIVLASSCTISLFSQKDFTKYVKPIIGSQTHFSLSNGNVYPCIALPWGMNHWAPQTYDPGNDPRWFYSYNANFISGIRQTHQPSPWIADYAAFVLQPTVGEKVFLEKDRKSWFSHKSEEVRPNYYKVYLAEFNVTAELTPSERGCMMLFTFPKSDKSNIIIDAFDRASYVKVIPEKNKVVGYSRQQDHAKILSRVPENFKNYFVIEFDKPFHEFAVWKDSAFAKNTSESNGDRNGVVLTFATKSGEVVTARIASSFISAEQAELNLSREIGSKPFAQIEAEGKLAWNKQLSRFRIEDDKLDDLDNVRMFYSTLYRILLFPRSFFEYDINNKIIHYSPFNGQVLPGRMYTDNGFWDTFRAVHPFYNLFFPEQSKYIMEGLANTYKESGWLPEWASPGHFECMIGSNSASLIASAYLNEVKDIDINTLWEAVYKNAYNAHPSIGSVGRAGIKEYDKLGYVPNDVKIKESAARTLEYAYADFCILRLAQALGKDQKIIDVFQKRSMNYKNIFYPKYNLMAGKNSKGEFRQDFNPFTWGGDFTEGNSWHYSWSVFHDPAGLMNLMGGRKSFVTMLDSVFTLPPVFDESAYGIVIHEIREMQIQNFGQYAHGNQPIQHMIYLYDWAGEPWKAQYWARQVMSRLYHPTPDGYCGDEDNGQTSAWYVFSALGFYPVCPATGEYAIGSPLFRKVSILMENGKKLTISAPENSADQFYVNQIQINNQVYGKNYFDHKSLQQGGEIQFDMSVKPNKNRGTSKASFPYSLSNKK